MSGAGDGAFCPADVVAELGPAGLGPPGGSGAQPGERLSGETFG